MGRQVLSNQNYHNNSSTYDDVGRCKQVTFGKCDVQNQQGRGHNTRLLRQDSNRDGMDLVEILILVGRPGIIIMLANIRNKVMLML